MVPAVEHKKNSTKRKSKTLSHLILILEANIPAALFCSFKNVKVIYYTLEKNLGNLILHLFSLQVENKLNTIRKRSVEELKVLPGQVLILNANEHVVFFCLLEFKEKWSTNSVFTSV